jgi:ribosomal protein S18 acetylase RimI-like enzyme
VDLHLVILTPHSKISSYDVEDINMLLARLYRRVDRRASVVVSREDILDVAKRSRLLVVRDLHVPLSPLDSSHPNPHHCIIAMATLVPRRQLMGHFGFVEDVVTHPAYEGRGIGTLVNKRLIEEARRLGMKHIDLTSNPKRKAANHIYQKLGYKRRYTNVYRKKLD